MAQGVRAEGYPELNADLQDMLERVKWNRWHGKVDRALELLDELAYALEVENGSPEQQKLLKAVRAFETYVTNNRTFLPNYGERYRQGKTISTAVVESAVNQVVRANGSSKSSRCAGRASGPASCCNFGSKCLMKTGGSPDRDGTPG